MFFTMNQQMRLEALDAALRLGSEESTADRLVSDAEKILAFLIAE